MALLGRKPIRDRKFDFFVDNVFESAIIINRIKVKTNEGILI